MGRRRKLIVTPENRERIKAHICQLYDKFGNQTLVAQELGMSQSTFSQTLARLGLRAKTTIVDEWR